MTDQKLKQKQFCEFVSKLMAEKDTGVYESVISMVYTLIEDKHLISLNKLLSQTYPEYYSYKNE